MKKIFDVLALVLAINFLAAAGVVGWLFKSGHLDKDRVGEVKKILFPTTQEVEIAPTTQPEATTEPTLKLDELLVKATGRPAGEQVEYIRQTFDTQAAQLDRRERELLDLKRQVDLAKEQVARDRAKVEQDKDELVGRQQETTKLSSDKGFKDSLQLYTSMPAKQVKTIFLTLGDDVVRQYIEAMDTRTASKIIKEYKSADETDRIHKVLEKIRQSDGPAKPAPQAVVPQQPISP